MKNKVSSALKDVVSKRSVYVTVRGNSMLPFFPSGAKVKVEKPEDIKIGDVVVIERDSQLFIHRIIWKTENKLITKGDISFFVDPPADRSAIIGKVNNNPCRFIGLGIGMLSLISGTVFRAVKKILFS